MAQTIGTGSKTFFVVAEHVNMGMSLIDIKLTDNETWAKTQKVLMKVKADSKEEAHSLFRVRDLT